jgi:CRP/FNR family cyclic AMP-dependent transcriptional regulator
MLKNIPLFSGLDKSAQQTIAQHAVTKLFPAHTVILHEGEKSDSLYIILYGKVKVYASEKNGSDVILNIQGRGDFFGEMALLDETARSASVMTMEPTRLSIITKAGFRDCLAHHPDLAYELIRALTQRVRSLTDSVRNLALLDVYGRVARTLLNLATKADGKLVVEQKLTHQEIANMVGASREMVSRILKDLANKGYITVERKRITINEKLSAAK